MIRRVRGCLSNTKDFASHAKTVPHSYLCYVCPNGHGHHDFAGKSQRHAAVVVDQ